MAVNFKTSAVKPGAVGQYTKHLVAPPPVVAAKVEGVVASEKSVNGKIEHKGEQHIPVQPVVIGDCRVRVEGGRKLSDGNYGSFTVHVALEMPCSKDSLIDTFEYASDWVSARLEEALKTK